MPKNTSSKRTNSDEFKIVKGEIRSLKDDVKLLDIRVRGIKTSFEDETTLIKEQIVEFKDEVLGEVKAMREELTVALGQYSRHEDQLEKHEHRLSKLEKPFV